jgi:hypothetical protein
VRRGADADVQFCVRRAPLVRVDVDHYLGADDPGFELASDPSRA